MPDQFQVVYEESALLTTVINPGCPYGVPSGDSQALTINGSNTWVRVNVWKDPCLYIDTIWAAKVSCPNP